MYCFFFVLIAAFLVVNAQFDDGDGFVDVDPEEIPELQSSLINSFSTNRLPSALEFQKINKAKKISFDNNEFDYKIDVEVFEYGDRQAYCIDANRDEDGEFTTSTVQPGSCG